MRIAIDYDRTYTRDPDFWDVVIAAGEARGHEFVCITNRPCAPGVTKSERVPAIRILPAGDQFKDDAARAAGLRVDIWIDDMPGSISCPVPLL